MLACTFPVNPAMPSVTPAIARTAARTNRTTARRRGTGGDHKGFPGGWWVGYVEGSEDRAGASTVIAIRKADGQVLFQGQVGE